MKILYLFEHPVMVRDAERFGFAETRAAGVEVLVWDLSAIFLPGLSVQAGGARYEGPGYRSFMSVVEVNEELRQLDPRETYCVPYLPYEPKTFFLYRQLTRCFAYQLSSQNAIPVVGGTGEREPWLRKLLRLSPRRLAQALLLRIPGWLLGLRPADFHLLGGRRSQHAYTLIYRSMLGPATRPVWVHSLDYEVYLHARASRSEPRPMVVFLDEYLPFHWEFALGRGGQPIDPEYYYQVLRRFFTSLEEWLGLPVVIAAHPTADYESRPDLFGGREVRRGQTSALIKQASVVVGHASTSIGMAVLFQKPILITRSKTWTRTPLEYPVAAQAAALQKPLLTLETPDRDAILAALEIDPAVYARYREDYIKVPEAGELLYWEVVIECARRSLGRYEA